MNSITTGCSRHAFMSLPSILFGEAFSSPQTHVFTAQLVFNSLNIYEKVLLVKKYFPPCRVAGIRARWPCPNVVLS